LRPHRRHACRARRRDRRDRDAARSPGASLYAPAPGRHAGPGQPHREFEFDSGPVAGLAQRAAAMPLQRTVRAAPADLRRGRAALDRIVADASRALQVSTMMAPLLEASSLSKFYAIKGAARGAKLHAVDDVSLTIGAGESVGLVGESGCGKSTIVRLLGRLIDPTMGRILLAGDDITAMSQAQFTTSPGRRRIQIVF